MRSTDPTFTETARRAQIIDVAIETIAELGYAQASVRKIADRVGVAMSVVLYHFGNKDELVTAIVAELYRSLVETMVPEVRAADTAAGKLAAHIRAHSRYIATHRAHQAALMDIGSNYRSKSGAHLAELSIDLKPAILADLAEVQLEKILADGVDTGEFRTVPVDSMATAIRSAIGGGLMKLVLDSEFDVVAYGDDLVDAFRRATSSH